MILVKDEEQCIISQLVLGMGNFNSSTSAYVKGCSSGVLHSYSEN